MTARVDVSLNPKPHKQNAASDLGLLCLIRHVCPNSYGISMVNVE